MQSRLDAVDLSLRLKKKEYEKELRKWQLRLLIAQRALVDSGRTAVIAIEGWDAAGKGGAIKRMTEYIDPRFFKVYGVRAPTETEAARHYLWRFWSRIPTKGELVIFDRTWYGRVLVERIEGFATDDEWRRAYDELNSFERQLHDDGTIVIKLWMHFSPDEQLKRFKAREDNPLKSWKMGDEDWRNRARWDDYVVSAEEMFSRTDTEYCPWYIVPAEQKRYGRVFAAKTVVQRLEAGLGIFPKES